MGLIEAYWKHYRALSEEEKLEERRKTHQKILELEAEEELEEQNQAKETPNE
jgi:hypothetical protein